MNVALFGGTFDPVHCGHLSAAQAAMNRFALDQVHFVPAGIPPHKRKHNITAFAHRYAMVAMACAGIPQFLPSLLESEELSGGQPNYSLVTVRKMSAALAPGDQQFFLIGADAFLDIPNWHEPAALLDSCHFIVVSRPGFPMAELEKVIPGELRGAEVLTAGIAQTAPDLNDRTAAHVTGAAPVASPDSIRLRKSHLHLLNTVEADISSSAIRRMASEGKPLAGLVPDGVAEYIYKMKLFANEK